jgi:hypothetical protein
MQSEEFDNRIREAADHHHPAYDEQAWMKMEKLLDKHLPQKKDDRRRFIFFLLLFLLIGGGITGLLLFGNKGKKDHPVAITSQQPVQPAKPITPVDNTPAVNQEEPTGTGTAVTDNDNENTIAGNNRNTTAPFSLSASDQRGPVSQGKRKTQQPAVNPAITPADNSKTTNELPGDDNKLPFGTSTAKPKATASGDIPAVALTTVTEPGTKQNPITGADLKKITTTTAPLKKEEAKEEKATAQTPVRLKAKRSSSFSLNFSAGPDLSIVGSGKTGKMNLLAGIGLGYTYKDRVTIRTGFYSGSKIYSAAPGDYHAPAVFYYYYPNLEKIDANCRVYEIPLSVSYHFGRDQKQDWFVSSGVSSYLMKKETYNYFYKQSPTSPTISRERTLLGVNKHYFSMLTVSGGYERHISKAMTIAVEPYLKLPLTGVGYGKVMLKSSGVLFTVGVKPFELFRKQKK